MPAETVDPRGYAYKKRPYAQACFACKARKIRCVEAENPPCKGCRTSRIPCEFPERSRRRRVTAAGIGGSEGGRVGQSNGDMVSASPGGSVTAITASAAANSAYVEQRLRRIEHVLNLPPLLKMEGSDDEDVETHEPPHMRMEPPRFKLGGSDLNEYHGETSMHDDGQHSSTDPSPATGHNPSTEGWSPAEMRDLRRLRHKYATPDEGEALIEAYFIWASTSTGVVNRSVFLRDMAVGGALFSDLLLLVIYVSGLRFSPNMDQHERKIRTERYMSIIMSLIADELCKPSSICGAQALLSLAGTRCAVGDVTQAWMLTGMAIRMIQDLGIHLAIEEPGLDVALDQETRDLRVRLYWSAYSWDKVIALGMGREPCLLNRPKSIPKVTLRDSDDNWEWRPYFPGGGHEELVLRYPHTMSRTTCVLRYSSQLHMILESILVNMYSPHRPHARSLSFIEHAEERLKEWRADLPDDLWIDRSHLPEFCPPTNVVVLNLQYHVMRILLYRPLLTVRNQPSGVTASSFDVCRTCAIEIHAVLSLWGRTYGNINMVYLIMYTTFVAAGVDIIILRIGDAATQEEALKRVHLSLEILEQSSVQGPGIRRAIGIIASQLQATMQRKEAMAPPPRPIQERSYAESSVRHDGPASVGSSNGAHGPGPVDLAFAAAGHTLPTGAPFSFEYQKSPADFLPLFDDPQAIANLLGDSNVGTDDPFAFLSGDGWDSVL